MAVKFGVQLPQSDVEWSELLHIWQALDEDSPFESAWTMDHFVTGRTQGEAGGSCLEGWTALAALAQATRRIRVGCLVTGVTYRHPAVLAKMATTVDIISNGRLEFGIGAAWHEYEHRAYGIPFPTMKERQDRLEEALQLMKALWASPPARFQGKYYRLEDAPYNPPNVQKPHPPIMIGGSGPKRTLRTAARYADAVNLWGPPEMVRQSVEALKGHCQDVGRDFSQMRVTVFLPIPASMDAARAITGRFVEAGFDDFIVTQFTRPDLDTLLRFADEVIPAFR
ncbi:MAG: TIGR03560 family F420-dependent LLM class oxidoreductase [Chloroflexota bacterium]|nr:TIGR03560 family F420-dependent LLM class oxidoreductase [Chloroflexota bacterium]